jgi:hypothetical protein
MVMKFGNAFGAGVVPEIILHLIYGAIVGAMYGPVSHRSVRPRVKTTPGRV